MKKFLLALLVALTPAVAVAQGLQFNLPIVQFFTSAGAVLNGGKVCFYAAGTTTPQATYSDATLVTPNTNPVVLNSAGRFANEVYYSPVSYKVVLMTAGSDTTCATGSVVWTADQVPGGYAASILIAGTINTARLGSGAASASTFLRGDSTWSAITTTSTVVTSTSTGTQNDFAPGLSGNTVLRMNNATLVTITGFASGTDGQILIVESVGAGQVDLPHQNAGSVVGNRLINFATTGSTSLAAGSGKAIYVYDATTARWRLVSHEQGTWISYATTSTIVGWAASPTAVIRYRLNGNALQVQYQISGTSNSVGASFTIPYTTQANAYGAQTAFIQDNSASLTTSGRIENDGTASTILSIFSNAATGAWTAANTKIVRGVWAGEIQ